LLDRIDIHIRIPRVEYKELTATGQAESSAEIRNRVENARQIQRERLKAYKIFCNGQMAHSLLKKTCHLTDKAQLLLEVVFKKMNLSARSYDRIIKVARTIADLDHSADITDCHVAEAVQLRNDIGMKGM